MNRREAFEAWAPAASEWSAWAKPVVFALAGPRSGVPGPPDLGSRYDAPWAPSPAEGFAFVVDLPGVESVEMGIALARRGYRPVPLYNGVPHAAAVIPTEDLVDSLFGLAETIRHMEVPTDAPPAFLLDSRRLQGSGDLNPGKFDNRWIALPQDFPSANLLLARKIQRVCLVRHNGSGVADDLCHVLLRWQKAGIEMREQDPASPGELLPVVIRKPWGFRWPWYRLMALVGLSRNSAGGFGWLIPSPPDYSSGGG